MDTVNATSPTDTTSTADATSTADITRTTDADGSTAEGAAEGDATGARSRIDELDARIIALVQERRSVSAHIQQARIEAGGRRVHLAREMEILDRYRGELGRPGTQLAMTLLALCRGAL
jgi:chorismate mutase